MASRYMQPCFHQNGTPKPPMFSTRPILSNSSSSPPRCRELWNLAIRPPTGPLPGCWSVRNHWYSSQHKQSRKCRQTSVTSPRRSLTPYRNPPFSVQAKSPSVSAFFVNCNYGHHAAIREDLGYSSGSHVGKN